MDEEEWVLVDKVHGQLQAEILKGLLEAQGFMVWLNQEGAAHAYAVVIGTLGMVEILVPSSVVEKARQVLDAYYRGDFENMEFQGPVTDEAPAE
jgi:Putative prokaryotic signal transducing protein